MNLEEAWKILVTEPANSTAFTTSKPLTLESLKSMRDKLTQIPPLLIGVVCSPRYTTLIQEKFAQAEAELKREMPTSILGGVPIYTKADQLTPFVPFYNHELLRAYLKES